MRSRNLSAVRRLLAAATLSIAAAPAGEVDAERLNRAHEDTANWLTYYGSYRSWRYSPLDQIDRSNVESLRPVWAFESGITDGGMQSAPIVVDGVMYVATAWNQVFALNAATGELLWRYAYAKPDQFPTLYGPWNRGVAVAYGLVYMGTLDNHVVAIDRESGEEVWRVEVENARQCGCNITSAPLVVKDVVITGVTGGDSAHRGYLNAFDARTGRHRWRFWTIPGPGEPGHDTWEGDSWRYGGGSTWITGTYDPELDLLYWAVGNPAADFYGEEREGDNLYTDSVVALDPDTGELKWHYQQIPHDVWDYDTAYEIVLLDIEVDGRPRKTILNPSKSRPRVAAGPRERRLHRRVAPRGGLELDHRHRSGRRAARPQRAPRGRDELHLPRHRRRAELESRSVLPGHRLVLLDRPGVVPDADRAQGGARGGHALLRRRLPNGASAGRKR